MRLIKHVDAGIVDLHGIIVMMQCAGAVTLKCELSKRPSLVVGGVMKRYFEILFNVEKGRYSNIALRFPIVTTQNPFINRGFGCVSLAGYARACAHARPHMRNNTPLG